MHSMPPSQEPEPSHEHQAHLSRANRERLAMLRLRARNVALAALLMVAFAWILWEVLTNGQQFAQSAFLMGLVVLSGSGGVALAFVSLLLWFGSRDLEESVSSYSSRPLGTYGTFVKIEPRLEDSDSARGHHGHDAPERNDP